MEKIKVFSYEEIAEAIAEDKSFCNILKLARKIHREVFDLNFSESIGEDKQLKALSGAKHILLKKIFEV